jgi:hypothetical protein
MLFDLCVLTSICLGVNVVIHNIINPRPPIRKPKNILIDEKLTCGSIHIHNEVPYKRAGLNEYLKNNG